MTHRTLLSIVVVPMAIACGSAPKEVGDGRSTLSGSVALTSYAGSLDNPVIVAQTVSGSSFVSPVSREGRFALSLPATARYRVLLASTRRDGTYRAVSEIKWGTEQAAWGSFARAGMTVDVGTVRPVDASILTVKSSGSGSGGDDASDDATDTSGSGSSHDDSPDHDSAEDEQEVSSCYRAGRADLPCNTRPALGQSWKLEDAFREKGAPPAAVLDVTMEGGGWRLAELKAGTAFVVTQADCDHDGNRDKGRDRVVVTWLNADGSQETDKIDIRYCDGGSTSGSSSSSAASATGECKPEDARMCSGGSVGSSSSDGGSLKPEDDPAPALGTCASDDSAPSGGASGSATGSTAPAPADVTSTGGGAGGSGPCVVDANCGAGFACYASVCVPNIR